MIMTFHTPRNTGRTGRRFFISLFLTFLLTLAGTGCKDKPAVPKAVKKKIVPAASSSATTPAPVSEAAGTEAPEASGLMPLLQASAETPAITEAAKPAEKRDPFRSFIEVKSGSATTRKQVRRLQTPLQKYTLDQLKVVGVIDGGRVKKALLEDDAGKGYVVSTGDYVGNQGGRIIAIKSDRLVIQETRMNARGESAVRNITKKLYAVKKDILQ